MIYGNTDYGIHLADVAGDMREISLEEAESMAEERADFIIDTLKDE